MFYFVSSRSYINMMKQKHGSTICFFMGEKWICPCVPHHMLKQLRLGSSYTSIWSLVASGLVAPIRGSMKRRSAMSNFGERSGSGDRVVGSETGFL